MAKVEGKTSLTLSEASVKYSSRCPDAGGYFVCLTVQPSVLGFLDHRLRLMYIYTLAECNIPCIICGRKL